MEPENRGLNMRSQEKRLRDERQIERRSGKDRRQKDVGGPNGRERRKSMEPRKPEVVELDLSESEWAKLEAGGSEEEGWSRPKAA